MYNDRTAAGVAIIGSGYGFNEILPAVLSTGNIKISLMKPRDYSESKYQNTNHPNVTFATLDEIANDSSVKIVFIALPPFLQFQFVEYLAPFGKSIYLEKPGGLNSEEALKIKQLVMVHKNNLYVGFQLRFDPIIQIAKEIVKGFESNERKSAKVIWEIKKSINQSGWKEEIEKGGGVYRDHLCHITDLLRNIFGFSEDSFGPNLQLISAKSELIDNICLKSEKIEIEIRRGLNLNSSLHIQVESVSDSVQIKNAFPLRLGDYRIIKNSKSVDFPLHIDLNQDARRYALKNYITRVFDREFKGDTSSRNGASASIEDAIFAQILADRIYAC